MVREAALPYHLYTLEEYLLLEEASDVKHELVAGVLYAQAGATRRHNLLASRLIQRFWNAVGDSRCQVFGSDMRLVLGQDTAYYPDVSVVCDPNDTDERFIASPCLVVEILSPGTEDYDRREKLSNYRRIPSLLACLLVHPNQPRVERYWRETTDAPWQAMIHTAGMLRVPCPAGEIDLDALYAGIEG